MYKEQRTKVKKIVQESKIKAWEDFGSHMERNSKENQKILYKVLKNIISATDVNERQKWKAGQHYGTMTKIFPTTARDKCSINGQRKCISGATNRR